MENAAIIKKVTEPTDWCSLMVVVPKQNGDVGIRVDLRRLNREVRRERSVANARGHGDKVERCHRFLPS